MAICKPWKSCSFNFIEAIILVFLFSFSTARAQTPDQGTVAQTGPTEVLNADEQKKEKRSELLVAPIPISSPAIGTGLEWAVGYLFPFSKKDKQTPNSVFGVGGLFTNNGSRGLAVGGRFYIKDVSEDLAKFLQIRSAAFHQAQCRQRLIEFVCEPGRQFAERGDPREKGKLLVEKPCFDLRLAPFGNAGTFALANTIGAQLAIFLPGFMRHFFRLQSPGIYALCHGTQVASSRL